MFRLSKTKHLNGYFSFHWINKMLNEIRFHSFNKSDKIASIVKLKNEKQSHFTQNCCVLNVDCLFVRNSWKIDWSMKNDKSVEILYFNFQPVYCFELRKMCRLYCEMTLYYVAEQWTNKNHCFDFIFLVNWIVNVFECMP